MSAQPLVNDVTPLGAPAEGTILAGAYRVDGVIASGGMGIVLRATELASERPVAVKLMSASAATDPEAVGRFRREAKAASTLTSKHVVRVLDFGDLEDGTPFLVMERLGGTTLVDVMKVRGPLPIAESVDYVLQAIHGVAEAHTLGIVHRDLKPANLFLADEGGSSMIKVLDFGASKLTEDSPIDAPCPGGMTVATSLIGSPRYMAPEQIRSALAVDARADVYALGATLYELLSGQPIFAADTLARIFAQVLWEAPAALDQARDDLPEALVDVVERCLSKSPEDRYATVEALAAALAPFGSTPGAPLPKALPRRKKREEPAVSGVQVVTSKSASPRRGDVVLRSSTQRMTRVRMASSAPRRTVKVAAFALAARLAPTRTQRMVRFEPPAVMPVTRAAPSAPRVKPAVARSAIITFVVMATLALLATGAVVRRTLIARSHAATHVSVAK